MKLQRRRYSDSDLWGNPKLQAEYDKMLQDRPALPSRVFVLVTVTVMISVLIYALLVS